MGGAPGLRKGVRVLETPYGFGRRGPAKVVGCGRGRHEADRLDGGRLALVGVERMRAVRQRDEQVHLGPQIDEVADLPLVAIPAEPSFAVGPDRREKADAGRHDRGATGHACRPRAGNCLGCSGAGHCAPYCRDRTRRRAAGDRVVGAAAIFDDGEHHPAHVGEQHAPLAERRRPLDLDAVGIVQAFGHIGGRPGHQGHRGGPLASRCAAPRLAAARSTSTSLPVRFPGGSGIRVDGGRGRALGPGSARGACVCASRSIRRIGACWPRSWPGCSGPCSC